MLIVINEAVEWDQEPLDYAAMTSHESRFSLRRTRMEEPLISECAVYDLLKSRVTTSPTMKRRSFIGPSPRWSTEGPC